MFKEIKEFINRQPDLCNDFIPVQNENYAIEDLLGNESIPFFRVLGRTRNGAAIAQWNQQPNQLKWEKVPVVWLDSEGSPNTVIANNLDEFIPLLFLDVWMIHKIITDDNYTPDIAEVQKNMVENKSYYPCYEEFSDFLKQLKIKPHTNPKKIIEHAVQSNQVLTDWLVEQKNNK
jgi:hypothetical protein